MKRKMKMNKSDHEDFLALLSENKLTESDFEITEKTDYPKNGVGPLYGEITIKYKPSDIYKTYEAYNEPWVVNFSYDLKANYYKTRH